MDTMLRQACHRRLNALDPYSLDVAEHQLSGHARQRAPPALYVLECCVNGDQHPTHAAMLISLIIILSILR